MVIFKTLSTGSSGNCYILDDGAQALVLEAGINANKIIKALSFNLEKTIGVLVTHEHMDHASGLKQLLNLGLTTYASEGTYKALKIKHHRAKKLTALYPQQLGNFHIQPFNVYHDAAEPLGFAITHKEAGRILFITDTGMVPYKLGGVDTIIIEANYREEYLEGMEDQRRAERVAKTHLSIEDVKNYIEAEEKGDLKQVILIHGSINNSDIDFKDEIEKIAGVPTYIANAGQVYEL